jgi:acyl carrier protein
MNKENIQMKVIEILRGIDRNSISESPNGSIDPDKSVELDSLNVLKLIVAIENEFNIEIDDSNLTREVIGSVSKITNYILGKNPDPS